MSERHVHRHSMVHTYLDLLCMPNNIRDAARSILPSRRKQKGHQMKKAMCQPWKFTKVSFCNIPVVMLTKSSIMYTSDLCQGYQRGRRRLFLSDRRR